MTTLIPTSADVSLLARLAQQLELPLSAEQETQFGRYLSLLLAWNARMNLTAVREPDSIQVRHFLDSLTCATVTGPLDGCSMIDVGTGAGFPGLPLKIRYPGLRLTLTDSIAKKTEFLTSVVEALNLEDVTVLADRAEDLGRNPLHREAYDWAIARSVAELRVLVEYLLPLVRPGGRMLAMKGTGLEEEIASAAQAVRLLGGSEPTVRPIELPGADRVHYLLVVDKIASTDPRYPRRVGVPAKRPL